MYDNSHHNWKINYEQDKGISVLYNSERISTQNIYWLRINKKPRGSNRKMGEVYGKAIHSSENLSGLVMPQKLLNNKKQQQYIYFFKWENHSEWKIKKIEY